MDKNEEYVRSVWEDVRGESWSNCGVNGFSIAIAPSTEDGSIGFGTIYDDSCSRSSTEAWAKAAEFTRSRLEEMRQLKRDRELIADRCADYRESIDDDVAASPDDYENMYGDDQAELIMQNVRRLCSETRILSHLKDKLSLLTEGMKPSE